MCPFSLGRARARPITQGGHDAPKLPSVCSTRTRFARRRRGPERDHHRSRNGPDHGDTDPQRPGPRRRTQRGTRTDDAGQYRLINIPPGTTRVRALRLGYEAGVTTVNVSSGGTATADFTLQGTVARLDEVVIAATGESERRREPETPLRPSTPTPFQKRPSTMSATCCRRARRASP
jgi:hypothetical protein